MHGVKRMQQASTADTKGPNTIVMSFVISGGVACLVIEGGASISACHFMHGQQLLQDVQLGSGHHIKMCFFVA